MAEWTTVSTAEELSDSLAAGAEALEVRGEVSGMPMITLAPGVRLRGGTLVFGAKGVRLTRDNVLEDVTIRTADQEVAILNDTSVADLGTLTLRGVRTAGQVLLVARDAVRAGHVQVEGLVVERADVRGRGERPHGFGVDVLQGAFTLWNLQPDQDVQITAELLDIGAGSSETPVRGSGVLVGGHGDWDGNVDGGTLVVSTLRTAGIHADGGIAAATPDLISGAVFVIYGGVVDQVINAGPVTTYGQNDMVLDNWGQVTNWRADAPVTSHGPSGIGFVNFADIDRLDVNAPIATYGTGARGFNLYEGSLRHASFHSIATSGDGAVGIQVSKPMGVLELHGDLTTSGSEGQSLVKGVQTKLKAIALSVKAGGEIEQLTSTGRIATSGNDVITVEISGKIGRLEVSGGIAASGARSDAVRVGGEAPDLTHISITSANGRPIVGPPGAARS